MLVVACAPAHAKAEGSSTPASSPSGVAACPTRSVPGNPVRAVIFSMSCGPPIARTLRNTVGDPLIGYWEPEPPLVESIEHQVQPALMLGRKRPDSIAAMPATEADRREVAWGVAAAIEQILANMEAYRCQYLGVILSTGARRVVMNCFVEKEAHDWTTRWIRHDAVDDGGASFWRIQYDPATERFLGFDVNTSG